MEILVMVAQLLLGLSILVGLHELGHLVAAKAFGMKVEKYSIGFPPKIWGKKFGETEYSIGAIPLGGFVKISGMIDESLDTENLKKDPEPWEFRAKPAWQRLIVMLGGIIVNVILGLLIFIFIVFIYGESYYAKDEVNKHGIHVTEIGEKIGLKKGDKIIQINGQDFDNFNEVTNFNLLLEEGSYYTIERDGNRMDVPIPSDFLDALSKEKGDKKFVDKLEPFKVGSVNPGGNAAKGGLKEGDVIVEVDGMPIRYFQEFRTILLANKEKELGIKVNRNGSTKPLKLKIDDKGKVGFSVISLLPSDTLKYSFVGAIGRGSVKAFEVISLQLKAFRKIFKGEVNASESLSGPLGMMRIYGAEWQWLKFWTITGMLSMILAFMNLLPIPALDGGHVMFLSYEIISGRPPSDKFLENSQKIGMVILLALMAFAIGNDVYKEVRNFFE